MEAPRKRKVSVPGVFEPFPNVVLEVDGIGLSMGMDNGYENLALTIREGFKNPRHGNFPLTFFR